MNAILDEKSSKSLSLAARELAALRPKLRTAGTKAVDNREVANRIIEEKTNRTIFNFGWMLKQQQEGKMSPVEWILLEGSFKFPIRSTSVRKKDDKSKVATPALVNRRQLTSL